MRAKKVIARQFKPDESRQGILGISMGAKQALAVVLKEENKAGFNVLGLLSGMRFSIPTPVKESQIGRQRKN